MKCQYTKETIKLYCVPVCSIRMVRRGGSQTTAAWISLRWSGKTRMISYVKPLKNSVLLRCKYTVCNMKHWMHFSVLWVACSLVSPGNFVLFQINPKHYQGTTVFSISVKWQSHTYKLLDQWPGLDSSALCASVCVFYLSATQCYGEQENRDFLYGGEEDGG